LVDGYVRDVLRKDSPDYNNRKRHLDWWEKNIGHLLLAEVTPAVIAKYRDKLLSEPVAV
jgi:hypothetical protein